MTEDLHQAVAKLERSRRRWRALALSSLALLVVCLTISGIALNTARQRAVAEQDLAMQAELQAREAAEAQLRALEFLQKAVAP
jgi:hypothetical protein